MRHEKSKFLNHDCSMMDSKQLRKDDADAGAPWSLQRRFGAAGSCIRVYERSTCRRRRDRFIEKMCMTGTTSHQQMPPIPRAHSDYYSFALQCDWHAVQSNILQLTFHPRIRMVTCRGIAARKELRKIIYHDHDRGKPNNILL